MSRLIFMVIAVFLLVFFISIPTGHADALPACAQLIETHCVECHYKARICQKLGKKKKRGWKRTMKNMVRYGVKLTKDELNILVDCLVDLPPGSPVACD